MPDLSFFRDPQVDRVFGVVMELAAEVHVLRDRLADVEHLLDQKGYVTRADLEGFEPDADEQARRTRQRDAFIQRILEPMTYEADSPAPPMEPA